MRRNKKKRIIIIGLIGILALMTAGYAAFQTNLNIKGTSKVSSNWNVLITSVTESNKEGEAETVGTPSWTELTAYMEANLYQKGDFVEYDVTVENRGTLDAKLESITDNIKSSNEAVKITFGGYTKGEKLEKGQSQIIKVKIEYNPDFTGTPEEGSGEVSIDLNYTQNNDYSHGEDGEIISPDRYLVTYDCTTNGGNKCTNYNEYLKEGETVNLNYSSNKEGFEFIGWNTKKDAEEGLTELQMLNQDITLYAIYKDTTPPTCEITVTEATINDVTVKATCTDASGIKEYNFKNSKGNNIQPENTFKLNNYKLSELTVEVTDNANNKGIFSINDDNLQKGYQLIYVSLNEGYKELTTKKDNHKNNLLGKTYPVGSIYITETNINPGETIGGTWEEYGKGKTLVGVDENDTNFNTVNKTGGSKTSTLAVTNLPSHTHSIPTLSGTADSTGSAHTHTLYGGILAFVDNGKGNGSINLGTAYGGLNWLGMSGIYSSGSHTHNVTTKASTTGAQGGTAVFTNMQPYITVYIWKRVS